MDPATALQEFVEYVVGQLISSPQTATISHEQSPDGLKHSYLLSVAPEDVGKIIGKNGQTIMAIRSLLSAAAVRNDVSATLKVAGYESERPER